MLTCKTFVSVKLHFGVLFSLECYSMLFCCDNCLYGTAAQSLGRLKWHLSFRVRLDSFRPG